jgi:hypothetical protein
MHVEWISTERPTPVYVEHFTMQRPDQVIDLHLLAVRYQLADALVGGDSLGEGHFLEYFVAERSSDKWAAHRLLQRASVTYSENEEESDYVPAAGVEDPAALSLNVPPLWMAEDAVWPTLDARPMMFVGQTEFPETTLTRELLTWGINAYLFSNATSNLQFKIVEQEVSTQTANEHYGEEEPSA